MSDENEPDITPEDENALAEQEEDAPEGFEDAVEAEVRRGGGNPFGGGMAPQQPEEVTKSFAITLPKPERHPLDTPEGASVPSAESAQLNMEITSTRESLQLRAGVSGTDELTHSQYEAYKTFIEAVLAN